MGPNLLQRLLTDDTSQQRLTVGMGLRKTNYKGISISLQVNLGL